MDSWEVYIIQASSGALYTGITNNFERRLAAHSSGKKGARFFRLAKPESVLFREAHPDRSSASQRESQIKKMTREEKLLMIIKLK